MTPEGDKDLHQHKWTIVSFTSGHFHRKCSRFVSLIWVWKLLNSIFQLHIPGFNELTLFRPQYVKRFFLTGTQWGTAPISCLLILSADCLLDAHFYRCYCGMFGMQQALVFEGAENIAHHFQNCSFRILILMTDTAKAVIDRIFIIICLYLLYTNTLLFINCIKLRTFCCIYESSKLKMFYAILPEELNMVWVR